ncbi:MAG TPA: methyltransferase domain-containing protein [Pirellulales bacterium]|nr:methyltransferase domain-containing protein [Pirellulales bacterium]
MVCQNAWNASLYDDRHAFVYQHGADLIDLLKPQPGERILDLGCGTGHLTAKIADAGADVLGIDASSAMVEQARRNFPGVSFEVADARGFRPDRPFDAVFSNAALHWIRPPGAAVETIACALKAGGRFVAEFGGRGNVRQIVTALEAAIGGHFGRVVEDLNPWYFPSIAEYASLLERAGLEVRDAWLFDRPTPLDDGDTGMANWLAMFGEPCLTAVPEEGRSEVIARAIELMRPHLWGEGRWTADYRRLRVVAVKDDER